MVLLPPIPWKATVSELYKQDRDKIPSFMRYIPRQGETLVYEEIYIPDVDP